MAHRELYPGARQYGHDWDCHPLFAILNKPGEGLIDLYHTIMLVSGSFLFAVLAWVIPARAASIASRGMALGLHGGTVTAAAMTVTRFGMMAQGRPLGLHGPPRA